MDSGLKPWGSRGDSYFTETIPVDSSTSHFRRRGALALAIIALVLLAGVTVYVVLNAPPRPPMEQGVYIWQSAWTHEVRDAVRDADATFDAYYPLCGEVSATGGAWHTRAVTPDWGALQQTGIAVWPVFRADNSISKRIAEDVKSVAAYFAALARATAADAERAGVTIAGIQIDYDCPTQSLPAYGRFLTALQTELPGTALSITALPTWLGQASFRKALAPVAHYTLQVHGLERPSDVDAPATLCDTARIPGWLAQAEDVGWPFHVALPTYTYRLYFAPNGEFAGIGAEGASEPAPGYTMKEIRADADALAGVVRTLKDAPPDYCRGFHWFRLPVAGDRLNWPWPVLTSVMQGVAPDSVILAEVRMPEDGLFEVWLRNAGTHTPAGTVRVPLHWRDGEPAAQDALGNYHLAAQGDDAATLTGPPPAPGEERMAAWLRMDTGYASLEAGDVEIGE